MIRRITLLLLAGAILLSTAELRAEQQIWQDVSPQARGVDSKPGLFQVDDGTLRTQLMLAPHESTGDWSHRIRLPMPDGKILAFSVVESPIVAAELGAKYPGIKTFKVRGIDDSHASGRIGITSFGLHGMIYTSAGVIYLDPEEPFAQTHIYRSRFKSMAAPREFSCGVHDSRYPLGKPFNPSTRSANRIQGQLQQYDLAIAATIEYHQFFGNSIAKTIAAITMTIMRVNTIYERDLGITLKLVADNDDIIETVDDGLLNNESSLILLGQVENWIDTNLPGGDTAYDIGHMFSAPSFVGSGVAFLGVVCDDDRKADGVTGLPNPGIGDPFAIDFVAHEIGHQFNADHSFNGTTLSCGGASRNPSTAFEPGSGSTIMGYAGICGVEDLQLHSDATFHAGSIVQINSFSGTAGNCFTPIATSPPNNADPVISPIDDRTIPLNTAFTLAGKATDAESGTMLTYQWDQMDVGMPTDAVNYGSDQGDNPLFRSYLPQNTGSRDFPALGTQLQKLYDDAEVVSCQARHLDFRLTARDDDSGQGIEDVRITVSGSAGPFRVTSQALNETISAGNGAFIVNWDVASTDIAPVSCPDVAIELLAFDDSSYTNHTVHTLVASVPNNGSAAIAPTADSLLTPARGRLRVRCLNNFFYALSQGDLQFVGTNVLPQTFFDANDIATFFNNNGTTGGVPPACKAQSGDPVDESSGGGSGAIDYLWLLMMTGMIAVFKLFRRYGLQ